MPYDIIIGRDEADKKLFGKKGLIYIGKSYVKMGNYTSLSNPVYLDFARSHVILISGKRGSGKSYSIAVIAESLSEANKEESQNIASLIFDTMGVFWTMKYKNQKDKELLDEWGLKPKNVPLKVFAPFGYFQEYKDRGIEVDNEFALKISELTSEDWVSVFALDFREPTAVLVESVISKLKNREKFDFTDIKKEILNSKEFSQEVKNIAFSLFEIAETWKIFDEEKGIETKKIISAGETSVIDLSMYSSTSNFNIRALVIGLVCKKLFNERVNLRKNEEIEAIQHGLNYSDFSLIREMPLVWIFIDEAHEFLPNLEEGKTPATDTLVQLLREGRQPGISLVMATQQPGKMHSDAITQSDIVLSHRVTSEQDIKALNEIMQSYLYEGIKTKLDELPKLKGSAIILDDNSERIYTCKVRPRFTWHGGESLPAVQAEKEE